MNWQDIKIGELYRNIYFDEYYFVLDIWHNQDRGVESIDVKYIQCNINELIFSIETGLVAVKGYFSRLYNVTADIANWTDDLSL